MSRAERRERICYACLVLVAVHLVFSSAQSGSWWSLGVSDCGLRRNPECGSCAHLHGNGTLNDGQTQICERQGVNMGAIRAISRGARDAIIDCQSKFEEWRWNCSTFFGQNLFGSFINEGTRETAVVYAYMNAGAVVGVAEACHDKQIAECPCNVVGPVREEDEDKNVIFNECSDNVRWAEDFVEDFVRNSVDPVTPRDLMDNHNANAGRKSIGDRTPLCNCHGISGTCSVKTCYQKAPVVEEVGVTLRTKYDGAVQVEKDDETNTLTTVAGSPDTDIADEGLVFVEDSPNFCEPNVATGVLGTKDRLCVPNSQEPNGCSSLCCGRGYRTVRFRVDNEVCRFVWCCRIECSIDGFKEIIENRCN